MTVRVFGPIGGVAVGTAFPDRHAAHDAGGAHIQPLGRPHDGPDVAGNILCLCPNDHVRFDRGAITVDNDGRIVGMDGSHEGQLLEARGHSVDLTFLAYHRDLFGSQP